VPAVYPQTAPFTTNSYGYSSAVLFLSHTFQSQCVKSRLSTAAASLPPPPLLVALKAPVMPGEAPP
jgi:hypothetical protein